MDSCSEWFYCLRLNGRYLGISWWHMACYYQLWVFTFNLIQCCCFRSRIFALHALFDRPRSNNNAAITGGGGGGAAPAAKSIFIWRLWINWPFISVSSLLDSAPLAATAYYGILFPGNEEAAFSNFRLFEASGSVIAYILSPMLCTDTKIIAIFVLMIIGSIGYLLNPYNLFSNVFIASVWMLFSADTPPSSTSSIKKRTGATTDRPVDIRKPPKTNHLHGSQFKIVLSPSNKHKNGIRCFSF